MEEQFQQGELLNSPNEPTYSDHRYSSVNNEASCSKSATKKPSSSRTFMKWTDEKDLVLCKEVALQNPFQFRKGTLERGKVWSLVAAALKNQSFKVEQRAVRDRYNSLQLKTKKTTSQEKRASGISPEVSECQREITALLEDLTNQEEDAELLPKIHCTDEEQKRLDGQEVQKRACESYVESRKRLFTDKEMTPPSKPSKKRNSGGDALLFLHKKVELEREIKKEELSMRKAEVERREREEERQRLEAAERARRFELFQEQQQQMHQQLLQHQQQMQQQFLQQQQQTQNMMVMLMQTMKGGSSKQ